jgi:hypothetical protein
MPRDPQIGDDVIQRGRRYIESQHAALEQLAMLSAEAVDPQRAEVQAALLESEQAARRNHDKRVEQCRAALEAGQNAARAAHDARRAEIERQHATNLAELNASFEAAQSRVRRQAAQANAEAKHCSDERVLMAETIAPATVEGFAKDLRRDESRIAGWEAAREVYLSRVDQQQQRYRIDPPEAAIDEATLPDAATLFDETEQLVSALEHVPHYGLVSGATPVVLGVVAIGGVVGLLGALPLLGVAIAAPFAVLGPVAGLVTFVALFLLWRRMAATARRTAEERARAAAMALFQMRALIQRERAAAIARFEKGQGDANARRAEEMQHAAQRLAAAVSQAAAQSREAMARIESEVAGKQQKLRQAHDQRLDEINGQLVEKERAAEDDYNRARDKADSLLAEQLAEIRERGREALGEFERVWDKGADGVRQLLDQAERLHASRADWDDCDAATLPPVTRFGANIPFAWLSLDMNQVADCVRARDGFPVTNGTLCLPAILALPTQGSMLIESDRRRRSAAIDLLRAVIVRVLTMLPAGRAQFTIFDPVGLGENFAGLMHLVDYQESLLGGRIWTESEHFEQRLADLTNHMETVIQKYLRNEFDTIAAYNAQAGDLAEPYRFLVIVDYPTGFSDTSLARLQSIVRSGARCGVFSFVACEPPAGGAPAPHWDDLRYADPALSGYPLDPEKPPSEQRLTEIMHAVGREAQKNLRVEVPFDSIAPTSDKIWTLDSTASLCVPIGRSGAARFQQFRLGDGLAQHVLMAGKTGSGKSTLLHVLITNLALWYSPKEVELYLVDFKKGVEFKPYVTHGLPHARAIAIESDREFGLSVLQRIDAEMHDRGEIFRAVGVQTIAGYRTSTGRELPRTLLIVDEFQVFFGEDDRLAQEAGVLLDRLVRQGRAFGIHVVLGSQTLAGNVALARSTLGQMAVRIALQCAEADAQLILDDANTAARLLTRPGEAIYNDAGGLVEGNSPFQTAWLSDERRAEALAALNARRDPRAAAEPTIVFEGNTPADIRTNTLLEAALAGHADANQPPTAWLGAPVAIKSPSCVTLRRQPGAHLLIVGQQERAAMAVLSAAVVALAVQRNCDQVRFIVLDSTPEDDRAESGLARAACALPHSIEFVPYTDVGGRIRALATTVRERLEPGGNDATLIVAVIHGIQRYRVLRQTEDDFSFGGGDTDEPAKPDRELAHILREGPGVGVHVLAWSDTLANLERTLGRGGIREFDSRLLFQMAAGDSSNLIDSPEANRLGPHRALLFNEQRGVMEKLRPYAELDGPWLETLATRLGNRPSNA